jgi:hypothetical protein
MMDYDDEKALLSRIPPKSVTADRYGSDSFLWKIREIEEPHWNDQVLNSQPSPV